MVESPKNRKGKKLAYSAPVAAIFLIAAILGMQFGCTDSTTAPGQAEQTTIRKDVYGAISGVVHDLYTNAPLRGVQVTLQGIKQAYTVSTDRNGHFRINSVFLGTVTGITGGAGFEGGSSIPQRAEFDFPLFFRTDSGSYAPWKERVALGYEYIVDNGTIVIPSGTFFEVGRTGLMPYVQSFTGTVYAGPGRTPAKGVTVMLDHLDYPSDVSDWPYCQGNCPDCEDNNCEDYDDYVELVNSFAVTDDNGVFTFDLADRVVAYDYYGFIVNPYDVPTENLPEGCVTSCEGSEDPACVECECFACAGDGIYEYDSMYTDLNLAPQPESGFDLMGYQLDGNGNPIVVQTHQFAVNLQHGSNSLEVIYCSLSNIGGGIIPANYNNFVINVTFNYPLKGWAFRLLKDQTIPVAIRVVPTSAANISFDITPIDQLNVAGNTWRFQIYAVEDYSGNLSFGCDDDGNQGTSGFCYWDFNVAGYVPPVGPIVPRIDVNVGSSQTFSMTVPDRSAIYRLYKSFGETSPFGVLALMQASADLFPWLNIAFDKPAAAVGTDSSGYRYYAFLRDSAVNSAWVQQPVDVSYEDNQSVEGQVYLPSNFMSTAGGDNNWLGDNKQIHMTILPVNEDGFIDMTQLQGITSASYRVLEDLWGPMIVGENVSIYGSKGTYSADGGTLYDEADNIAFHEILNGSVAPTVTETSANFDVAAVFMDEKHTFVTTEFAPAVTATLAAPASDGDIVLFVDSVAGFYPGDNLALYLSPTLAVKTEGSGGPFGTLTLAGFDSTLNVLILNRPLGRDHAAGEVVAMLGPMQAGFEAGDWYNELNQSTQQTSVYIAVAPDALGNFPPVTSDPAVLIVNEAEVQPIVASGLPVEMAGSLLSAYPAGTSAKGAVPGRGDGDGACCDVDDADVVANTVLLLDGAGGATSITVEDGTDIAVGDWLKVGTRDYVKVASVTPGADQEATVTFVAGQSLHQFYSARLTAVVELTVVTDSVTLLAYPLISVQSGIDDLLPGSSITITDGVAPSYNSTALSAWAGDNNWIGLADLPPEVCLGACRVKNFVSGSTVLSDSTRTEDSIQVIVQDTSGNSSLATDKDGDGQADFDELELWGGNVK